MDQKRINYPDNRRIADPLERFWSKVDKTEACWLWLGSPQSKGYGSFSIRGRRWLAHRYAWEVAHGPVPAGRFIDHKCHNRLCVRLDHLQVVTPSENEQNRKGATRRSKTGVRGVWWDGSRQKYAVTVRVDGRTHHGGRFTTLAEAEAEAVALRNRVMTNNLADREEPLIA